MYVLHWNSDTFQIQWKERFPGDIICLARVNNNNNNKFITYIVQITWVYDQTCITHKKLTLQD